MFLEFPPQLVPGRVWGRDGHPRFTESNCARGGLGHFAAVDLMPLMLAHALRLDKYGA